MDVTRVTADATLDDLSASDYQDIVIELRGRFSLDKLISELRSKYSKPLWADVEKGSKVANRGQRNEIRAYCTLKGIRTLPPLPPTVLDAVAAATSPDATVWHVGDKGEPAEHVIMVSSSEPLTLHLEGSGIEVKQTKPVTEVTLPAAPRRKVIRPMADEEQEARRQAIGATWREVHEAGLAVLEAARKDGQGDISD